MIGEPEPAPNRVRYAESAEADIEEAYRWLTGYSFETAERWLAGLQAALERESAPRPNSGARAAGHKRREALAKPGDRTGGFRVPCSEEFG
jgi:plasmid stabilization system protein ParE